MKKNIKNVIIYTIQITVAMVYLIPFYIVIITSFKADNAIATSRPFIWFPTINQIGIKGYIDLFITYTVFETGDSMILTGFKNTMIILVPVIIGGMFSSSISAYAFAKLKFRGKKLLFTTLLFTMMLPGIILLIPSYFIFDNLGLTNTFFPLIVPPMFGSATCIFFLKQYYSSIPNELLDAGKIDGMGFFKTYLYIIVPLSKPALIAQGLLGVVACYNDYLNPLIYLIKEKRYTLQIALAMFSTGNTSNLPTVMAGAVLSMLPILIIYLIMQRYFVNGLTMSGMKD